MAEPGSRSSVVVDPYDQPSRSLDREESDPIPKDPNKGRLRSASTKFLESNPPSGMWYATGTALAAAPTPADIRRGDFDRDGWNDALQRTNSQDSVSGPLRRSSTATSKGLTKQNTKTLDTHTEETTRAKNVDRPETGQRDMQNATTAGRPSSPTDEFSKFVGRGRIDTQSFVPKSDRETNDIEAISNTLDESEDEMATAHGTKRQNKLPNKFFDRNEAHDSVPLRAKELPEDLASDAIAPAIGPNDAGVYPNGYKFPPKHTWSESTIIGLKGLWRYTLTPLGFFVVLYCLNVVAWGGMLFLLLIGGGKAMCHPHNKPAGYRDCDDLYAPRRIWIEIDSQILNALFCVTGLGLIPWRFRDLYYILRYRISHDIIALRRLAGIHRTWFRLPGSSQLPVEFETWTPVLLDKEAAIALPLSLKPDEPLTGVRACDTAVWKLDFVIWAFVLNTFLQIVLCGFMWGLNRFDRPSWSTGLFIALACIVAAAAGWMSFVEGKKIKKAEGIPSDVAEVLTDIEKAGNAK